MRRQTTSGGVSPAVNRIQFDLHVDGARFYSTLPWTPTSLNLQRARERLANYRAQIAAGIFSFAQTSPAYRGRKRLDLPLRTLNRSEVFDRFRKHCAARGARDDLGSTTLASYRQILNYTWRRKIPPFSGSQHSTLARILYAQQRSKKTYNNPVSAIRRGFELSYRDHFGQRNPAAFFTCAHIRPGDRCVADSFSIDEAEGVIAALIDKGGEAAAPVPLATTRYVLPAVAHPPADLALESTIHHLGTP